MDFLEIKANNVYLLRVKVKTNSTQQEIMSWTDTDAWLSIKLKSKPVNNKANKELINLIKKRINVNINQIHIISGVKNTNKVLEIKFSSNVDRIELIKRLVG